MAEDSLLIPAKARRPHGPRSPRHPRRLRFPRCPRCGYDQRGVLATWSESCPLEGTCSECGLVFHWAEVIVPEKFEPRWCVEFSPRWLGVPLACLKTLARSFRPWRFWSQLTMSQRIRPLRLAAYVAVLIASLSMLYVPAQAAVALRVRSIVLRQMSAVRASFPASMAMLQSRLQSLNGEETSDVSEDQKQWMRQQLQGQIRSLQSMIINVPPPSISHSWLALVFEAIIFPLAQRSSATTAYGGALTTVPYVAPSDLWLAIGEDPRLNFISLHETIDHCSYGLALALVLALMLPAGMVLLPASRRKAKVRWSHIGRITVYSIFIPWMALASTALVLAVGLAVATGGTGSPWFTIARQVHLMMWIALPAWWAAAIRRYLRLPHAEGIVVALMIIIALIMLLPMEPVLPRWLVKPLLG